ncbi:MAG: alpha/beta hydrolase [Hyphomicrobiales bacterium]
MAWYDWGEKSAAIPVVCVHGLTRNGRDFDWLAQGLAASGRRVVALDMPGRGESDWFDDAARYEMRTYVKTVQSFMTTQGFAEVDWVGTSMGGMLGMVMASLPQSPVRRLVLNDIGALIPKAALQEIASYVGHDEYFPTLREVEIYLRRIHAGFGPLSDEQWAHMARHGAKAADGGYRLRYDPKIASVFKSIVDKDADMWKLYDAVHAPTLVLRGADSGVLLRSTAVEMQNRGPKAKVVEIEGAGHAPALMSADQIEAVRAFLA